MLAAALLAIGGGVAGLVWLAGRGDETPQAAAGAGTDARLVLDWPAEERGAAMVQIDGQKRNVPGQGNVAYLLPPGDHRLLLQRRGYEPIEVSLSLRPGDVHHYAPQWKRATLAATSPASGGNSGEPVPVGYEGWTQRYDAALRRAAQEKKDVLVAFVGSDWNAPSVRMARQIFPDAEFHRRAAESLVLVVIDDPQSQQGYEQLLDSAQNELLRQEFHIRGDDIPTLALLDSQGKPYAVEETYEAATGAELAADLGRWASQRDERDRLFARVEGLAGEERLRAAVAAVDWLRERGLNRFYGDRFRQWEQIALQHDPGNAAGYYEVLYEANWFARWFRAGQSNDAALVAKLVEEFDQWRGKIEIQDPDRAARLHTVAALSLFNLGRRDEAAGHIDEALARRPKDQQLLVQLQTLSEIFSGEIGSGTGFVVAPGYVLTNHHVIAGPGRTVVLASGGGEETPAEVVAADEQRDMALLQVGGAAAEAPPLPLAESQAGRGARVAAFGYPLGSALGRGLKLTTGVVSASPDPRADNMYLLDCRINPGNSGGPLCDRQGRVLGMVTAKSSISQDVDSYGMAIPADVLQSFLRSHIPGWRPASDASPAALEWDEIDRAVSASVLMVVKKR
jgi:S1-C subfamily serine protease